MSRPRRGFTLIELLVVIAIIAILAAILFPVFAKAREKARQASCQSNLKQISLAFLQYAQDFDETLPAIRFGDNPGESWPWLVWPGLGDWVSLLRGPIQPYMQSQELLRCPSGPDRGVWDPRVHYAYNEYLYNFNNGFSKLSSLSSAPAGVARISLVIESYASGIVCDWDNGGAIADGMGRVRYGCYDPWRANHEGLNIAYADGHVKFLPQAQVRSTKSTNNLQTPVIDPRAMEG